MKPVMYGWCSVRSSLASTARSTIPSTLTPGVSLLTATFEGALLSAGRYSQMSTLAKAPEPTLRMNLRREKGMRPAGPAASAAAAEAPVLLLLLKPPPPLPLPPSTLPAALPQPSPTTMVSNDGACSGWSRTDSRSRCL